jgi:hypothetical protein
MRKESMSVKEKPQPLTDEEIVAIVEYIESAEREQNALTEVTPFSYKAYLDIKYRIDTAQRRLDLAGVARPTWPWKSGQTFGPEEIKAGHEQLRRQPGGWLWFGRKWQRQQGEEVPTLPLPKEILRQPTFS